MSNAIGINSATMESQLDPQLKDVLLTAMQQHSPDGMLITGKQGQIVSYNQRFVDIWDISPLVLKSGADDAILAAMFNRVADAENFIAVINYLHQYQTEKNQEELLLTDGRTLERYSAAMFGQDDEYCGRLWYFRDITELKHNEKAFRFSAARLKVAADSGRVAVWEYNLQTEELIWDDSCLALYKLPREKFSGTFTEWSERIHPDDIVQTVTALQQAIASGREYNAEFRIIWPGGEVRYIKVHGRVIQDQPHGASHVIGTHWDVTELKQTEAALRSREGHLKLATTSYRIGIWEYNLQTRELVWDDSMFALYGARREDFSGAYDAWSSRVHPEDLAGAEAVLQAAITGACEYEPQFRIMWPDGEVRYIKGHAQIIRDQRGTPVYMMGTNWDDSAHARTQQQLQLAHTAIDVSRNAFYRVSQSGMVLYANDAACRSLGYDQEELTGMFVWAFDPNFPKDAWPTLWAELKKTGVVNLETHHRRKDGSIFPVEVAGNIIATEGEDYSFVFVHDITERKKTEELVWHQANFDFLTGLPNRRMFHDRLEQELKKAHRVGLPLALMFIDLDRFKEINDTLGHDMGDALLKEASHRLTSCVRDTDTISRLGGDEFTVILGELDDLSSVDRIAQNILQKLAESFRLGDEVAYISASIGITLYPEDATTVDALLKNADQAMYAAKNQGRNRHHYFTQSMQKTAQQRMRLVNDLRKALAGQQFRVYYQPIVELATGAIHKAEALIRWEHPTRGLISPADFIPLAEETGLIIDIGEWVFHQAVKQVGEWREFHDASFQVSVNKSPVQFRNEDRSHGSWLVHLEGLGLPGQCVVVEITEGLLLDTGTTVTDRLLEFRNAGIQVSLDDFGTGYSSLSYLKKFDIDFLKIDQSFVRNLAPGSSDLALCEAIIVMAHKLGMKVIAEGIETEQQRDLLVTAGCDYGQGHLFSEPVPADQFELLLQQQETL
ncbi:MAG TPA: EAL domain-containing protein [Methylophilaceae bacterium]